MRGKSDADMLDILARHSRGETHREIGARHGMTDDAVQQMVTRVREADIAHDPDAAHWWHNLARRRPHR